MTHRALTALSLLSLLLVAAARPPVAHAQATPGFVEDWSDGTDRLWQGGVDFSNPGGDGVGGPTDGYLLVSNRSNGFASKLGIYCSAPPYAGDWIAGGVDTVKFWLNDVGSDENLEIHFSFGSSQVNLWQYNVAFLPPHDSWAEFTVPLRDSASFTQIFGTGSFAAALRNVEKVHLRHDLPPFLHDPQQFPDNVLGDFGLDRFRMIGASTPARPTTWARVKSLYR